MRRTLAALATLAAFASLLPTAQAHGLVNAGELETLMVQDEASDVMTEGKLGYDLLQLYVGEAYVPGVGDGLYVHTTLYGGAGDRPALDGPLSVRFTFTTDQATFTRQITTSDGNSFSGDFDSLAIVPGSGEVDVQHAFVRYFPSFGPGSVLKGLKAESFVGTDLRDVAPGGMFVQGVPMTEPGSTSKQVAESYPLRGPVGYATIASLAADADGFTLTAHNPLKKGDEHILLLANEADGWHAEITGGGEVKAGGDTTIHVRLVPGTGTFNLDLVTDIGGRIPLQATHGTDGIALAAPGATAIQSASTPRESPSASWLVPVGLAAALLARRVKG
jgi:hypothetical protein